MSDIIDQANERIELDLAMALKRAAGHPPSLPYTGVCHNCGDITGGGRRFCDTDCRDDYDARAAFERRQ